MLVKTISHELYQRALKVIPGGVTRSFRFFEPYPFYGKKAYGSKLVDQEDRVYTDYWQAHGALVLGHMHPAIIKAVKEQLELGFHWGVCNEWEVKLAEQVVKLVPGVKMITFNNSGTEADMYAMKLARAYTKRAKIGKFEGHYHGNSEALYVATGWPSDEPDSAGHDPLSAKNTVVLPFRDADAAYKAIKKKEMACVVMELVTGGTTIPEEKEFVKGLREVCDDTDTLLIFDEVITGFRLAPGGGQEAFGVIPDLTVFGKAIGGGEFPVGAVGGRTEIMELMSSQKHPKKSECVAQGGTYSGNPLVMRAGYEATKIYEERKLYAHIDRLGAKLMKGLEEAVEDTGANARVTGYGSKVKIHFPKRGSKVNDMKSLVINRDTEIEKRYFGQLISNRIFALTQGMVHFSISLPHTEQEIDDLISATRSFLKSVPK
ncbi:MAG: aminotransferase class III-fold pyridoxal phosphate-dependent enzyme [Candidatus Bathyarchaeia archaeon]